MSQSRNAVQTLYFDDDGRTPNSPLAVVIHRAVPAVVSTTDYAGAFETLFRANDWPPQWRGSVFDYQHYHSVSHEALGVARGRARLVLGGEFGETVAVSAGDALVLPAGTGHCRQWASSDFQLVAAYPPDQQDWDLCRPGRDAIEASRARIAAVPRPDHDPVLGAGGGLADLRL